MNPKLLFCSEAMEPLARRIYTLLREKGVEIEMAVVDYTTFANSEGKPTILSSVRRKEVYLLWDLQYPTPNEQIMRLFFTIGALHRASVERIFLLLPYLPYMRQDRKAEGREPISARDLADQLELRPTVKNIMTFDLHADQEQGFFTNPVDNLPGAVVFANHFRKLYHGRYEKLVVVSTDEGGVVRARRFADMISLKVKVYNFGKRRSRANEAAVTYFNGKGEVANRDVVFLDDMIDTAGSLKSSVTAIRAEGVGDIYVAATHGIFSPKNGVTAEDRLINLRVKVFITESIPRSNYYHDQHASWLTILPLSHLLADAIYESFGGSVSALIKRWSSPDNNQ